MRDRLIELIASKVCDRYEKDQCTSKWNGCCGECLHGRDFEIGDIADHLLANGVIVLPCKVGDVVFQVNSERVYESTVKNVIYDTNGVAFDERAIGESIFLTREEAENALAERRNIDAD